MIESKNKNQAKNQNKTVRYSAKGKIYVLASFNNTLVTIADEQGKTLCWSSAGKSGFSGTRKSTPFAATSAITNAVTEAIQKHGLNEVAVYIKGAGPGREALMRFLRTTSLEVNKLVDATPIPHDGIRPKKRRRV